MWTNIPVEAEFNHVVPPDVVVDGVVRVVVPAVFDVPHPRLAPQHLQAIEKHGSVIKPSPPVRKVRITIKCKFSIFTFLQHIYANP